MNGFGHVMGSDLSLVEGGLALVNGMEMGRQSLLRRLMTVAGQYVWQTDYGFGLPAMVGQRMNFPTMRDAIKAQVEQDHAVDASQPVVVTLSAAAAGVYVCTISYVDAESQQRTDLSFSS